MSGTDPMVDTNHPYWTVLDRISRLLCSQHQALIPTSQPCAACVHTATPVARELSTATPSGTEGEGVRRESIVPTNEERAAARDALIDMLLKVNGDLRGPRARAAVEQIYVREIEALCEMGWEDAESMALRERMATLLHETTNVIKGDPGPLRAHSWHDLPEAARARLAAAEQRGADGGGAE